MSRGDVCWLELADEGRRPVCVLTRAAALPVLAQVTVALVAKTVRNIPTEVRLADDDGMPDECVIALDNVRVVPRALLTEHITSLSGKRMHEVCRALSVAMGCA